MNWSDHFPELKRQSAPPDESKRGPTSVQSLSDIPPEAAPEDVFRLPVDVVRVDERETRTGDPCYFLNVRDANGVRFSVVCWDWQWAVVRPGVVQGEPATLDVLVPGDGFRSFRLAVTFSRKDRTGC